MFVIRSVSHENGRDRADVRELAGGRAHAPARGGAAAQVRWRDDSNAGQALALDHARAVRRCEGAARIPGPRPPGRGGARSRSLASLYDMLWRLTHENRDLLKDARDPGVRRYALAATQRPTSPRRGRRALRPGGRRSCASSRAAAARCTGCDLYRHATQTVFGRGPGGRADRVRRRAAGRPGRPRRARRSSARPARYSTGAGRGGPRPPDGLRHQRRQALQVRAARQAPDPPDAAARTSSTPAVRGSRPSSRSIKPEMLVCLGATAARAIFGDVSGSRGTAAGSRRHAGRRDDRDVSSLGRASRRGRADRRSSTRCCSRISGRSLRGYLGRGRARPIGVGRRPVPSQAEMSRISSGQTECGIGYSCHSTR